MSSKRSGQLTCVNDKYIPEILSNPLYDVRADGTVFTRITKTGKIFADPTKWRNAGSTTKNDYLKMSYKRKNIFVHRIIYAKYLAGIDNNPVLAEDLTINHKNGVTSDNRPENLELITQGENNKHRFQSLKTGAVMGNTVLNWDIVRAIRADKKAGLTHREVVEKYGISKGHVSEIVNNHIWVEGHHYHKPHQAPVVEAVVESVIQPTVELAIEPTAEVIVVPVVTQVAVQSQEEIV